MLIQRYRLPVQFEKGGANDSWGPLIAVEKRMVLGNGQRKAAASWLRVASGE
jgi:hypothetical protein